MLEFIKNKNVCCWRSVLLASVVVMLLSVQITIHRHTYALFVVSGDRPGCSHQLCFTYLFNPSVEIVYLGDKEKTLVSKLNDWISYFYDVNIYYCSIVSIMFSKYYFPFKSLCSASYFWCKIKCFENNYLCYQQQ